MDTCKIDAHAQHIFRDDLFAAAACPKASVEYTYNVYDRMVFNNGRKLK